MLCQDNQYKLKDSKRVENSTQKIVPKFFTASKMELTNKACQPRKKITNRTERISHTTSNVSERQWTQVFQTVLNYDLDSYLWARSFILASLVQGQKTTLLKRWAIPQQRYQPKLNTNLKNAKCKFSTPPVVFQLSKRNLHSYDEMLYLITLPRCSRKKHHHSLWSLKWSTAYSHLSTIFDWRGQELLNMQYCNIWIFPNYHSIDI